MSGHAKTSSDSHARRPRRDHEPATTSLRHVVWPWLLSRVIAVAVLLVAVGAPRWHGLVELFDGQHYLAIARHGYGPVDVRWPRWPFFPGFPLIVRGIGVLGHDDVLAFLFNQIAMLVGLLGVYRLALRHSSERAAVLSVWLLAFFPSSFVFSMLYPSAVFFAVSVWAFLLVEDDHDLLAGLLAAVAAAVRPNGIVVALALLVAARSLRRAVSLALPTVAVLIAWCVYCYHQTGDALVFYTTKSRWGEVRLWQIFGTGGKTAMFHLLAALLAVGVVVLQRRRIPRSWLALTILTVVPSLFVGMIGLARLVNESFPPFVAAGQLLERASIRVQQLVIACSAVGMVALAVAVAKTPWLPP